MLFTPKRKGKKRGHISPRQRRSAAREVKLVVVLKHMAILTFLAITSEHEQNNIDR